MSSFGKRLSMFRKHLELSQQEFADRLKVHQVTVARYETNKIKPTSEFMQKLVAVYNINANWLLTGAGEMFTEEYAAKVDADFQESLDWMIEFCRKVADGEIEQTPEIEETLKSMTKIIKLTTDKGGSK